MLEGSYSPEECREGIGRGRAPPDTWWRRPMDRAYAPPGCVSPFTSSSYGAYCCTAPVLSQ